MIIFGIIIIEIIMVEIFVFDFVDLILIMVDGWWYLGEWLDSLGKCVW